MNAWLRYYLKALARGVVVGLAVIATFALIGRCCQYCRPTGAATPTVVTVDTVYLHDTVRIVLPVARDSIVLRYVQRTLPSAPDTAVAEHVAVVADSVEVVVPITQRVYGDSCYRAWVSGYEAQLDSIQLYTTTQVVRPQSPRTSRWSLGVTAGYGATQRGLQPYIGVAVCYRLVNF